MSFEKDVSEIKFLLEQDQLVFKPATDRNLRQRAKDPRYFQGIGLFPSKRYVEGQTPRARILNFAGKLCKSADEISQEDGKNFKTLLGLIAISGGKHRLDAERFFWNLDTAVRDTFFNIYTNNDADVLAIKEISKVLNVRHTK